MSRFCVKLVGKLLRNQQGAVAVLTALALTAMLGFAAIVVDVGLLYYNRVELANLADAAALAGVQDLPGDAAAARASALNYAARNGRSGDAVTVEIVDDHSVAVQATRPVELFFARVFGLASSTVQASARASVRPLSAATGVVPFGVVWNNFVFGETYVLKEGGGSGANGNYGALALGGRGANVYRSNIKYGYNGTLRVGDWVETEPGNMSGPTSDGVNWRISLDPHATFDTVQKGSPRIIIVPVLASLDVNGRGEVQIVGFAAFFLEGVHGSGKNNYVTGKFMKMYMTGETAGSTGDYGLRNIALVQ
ncbi:hypothetical protein TcarDRAFT_1914 [Thermosinus carboxydivorans Nor1]|uniref:Uncharacterized protein n=1 Tax=Thermosinus carboxydivorans Nor1 TaxID=401526 RepID=A1HPR7_9FIRM|nr:pilus assembly protein TadG-related protein [Thermosinus carboxydivorans]EAX48036.1 hypothetical protein TcarDRAFT_1914 [Thermosinus carboxydivorans Nor1]